MSVDRQPGLATVSGTMATTANAYAAVTGTVLDTALYGGRRVAYQVTEGNVNAITAKVQGSLDGSAWSDVLTMDTDGSQRAGVDVAVAKNGTAYLMVAPEQTNKAAHCWRYYRVAAKSTVADTAGTVAVKGIQK